MKRTLGDSSLPVVECINPKYNKYRVRYDYQPYVDDLGEIHCVSFLEKEFSYKPTLQEVKNTILDWENEIIDEKILSGFIWKDMPIWLSTENQFNYKAAFDLASTFGGNLPLVFKFGTPEDPIYYKFTEFEDLKDFYISAMSYINNTLAEGWMKKDSIDLTEYALCLE